MRGTNKGALGRCIPPAVGRAVASMPSDSPPRGEGRGSSGIVQYADARGPQPIRATDLQPHRVRCGAARDIKDPCTPPVYPRLRLGSGCAANADAWRSVRKPGLRGERLTDDWQGRRARTWQVRTSALADEEQLTCRSVEGLGPAHASEEPRGGSFVADLSGLPAVRLSGVMRSARLPVCVSTLLAVLPALSGPARHFVT